MINLYEEKCRKCAFLNDCTHQTEIIEDCFRPCDSVDCEFGDLCEECGCCCRALDKFDYKNILIN